MADPIFNFRWNQQPVVTNPLQPNMGVATPTSNTMTPNMKPDTAAQIYQEATPEQNGNAVPAQHTANNLKTQIDNLKAEKEKLLAERSKLEAYMDPVKKNAMMEANRARRFRKDNDSLEQYRWRREQEEKKSNREYQEKMHENVRKTNKENTYQSQYARAKNNFDANYRMAHDMQYSTADRQKYMELARTYYAEMESVKNLAAANEVSLVTPKAEYDLANVGSTQLPPGVNLWELASKDPEGQSSGLREQIRMAKTKLRNLLDPITGGNGSVGESLDDIQLPKELEDLGYSIDKKEDRYWLDKEPTEGKYITGTTKDGKSPKYKKVTITVKDPSGKIVK